MLVIKRAFLYTVTVFFFLFVDTGIAEPWSVPFYQNRLPQILSKSVVILGAGPAALLAAEVFLQKGYEQIFILEKREQFSRFNFINFYPENWVMLKRLGVDKDLRTIGIVADLMTLRVERDEQILKNKRFDVMPVFTEFDFKQSLKEMYRYAGPGLATFNLADVQHVLAQRLANNDKVFFIHAEAKLSLRDEKTQRYGVNFAHLDSDVDVEPDMIVVAEGAHSSTRAALGIAMQPILPVQYWCSGAVSIEGIIEPIPSLIQVLNQTNGNHSVRTFGIYNRSANQLFVNGQTSLSSDDVDACLKRNAWSLLRHYAGENLNRAHEIMVVNKSQNIIELEPSEAAQKIKGNIILYGDAAGYSTPKGGVGFSLITGPYPQALMDLLDAWHSENPEEAKMNYEERVHQMVAYWHEVTAR